MLWTKKCEEQKGIELVAVPKDRYDALVNANTQEILILRRAYNDAQDTIKELQKENQQMAQDMRFLQHELDYFVNALEERDRDSEDQDQQMLDLSLENERLDEELSELVSIVQGHVKELTEFFEDYYGDEEDSLTFD